MKHTPDTLHLRPLASITPQEVALITAQVNRAVERLKESQRVTPELLSEHVDPRRKTT